MSDIPNYEYNYMIQEREFIKTFTPVFKIGKTTKEVHMRTNAYPKNSRVVLTKIVNDCSLT